jgi:hypothetical protein
MYYDELFHQLSIWLVGIIVLIILLAALEFGYRVGLSRRELWKGADSSSGQYILTSMFALLGLILAFTYGAGVSRFDAIKQATTLEANVIRIAFLRANVVTEPGRTELKQALLDYARTRIVKQQERITHKQFQEIIQKSLQEQSKLWLITEKIVKQSQPDSFVPPMLLEAVNQVLTVHTTRVTAGTDRLPSAVLLMLLFIAAASLSVAGFSAGVTGHLNRLRMTTFALVLAGVLFIIYDFDHPHIGFIRVDQNNISLIINEMEANLAQ